LGVRVPQGAFENKQDTHRLFEYCHGEPSFFGPVRAQSWHNLDSARCLRFGLWDDEESETLRTWEEEVDT
jgi:hypothetical protein